MGPNRRIPKFKDQYDQMMFEEELKYWCFDTPEETSRKAFFNQLQTRVFNQEPTNLEFKILKKWQELGPFDVY